MITSEFVWKGYNWRIGQPWGETHPDKNNSWYGKESVSLENNVLKLSIKNIPTKCKGNFTDINGDIEKKYSIGLVSCEEFFTYGTYTWKAKLPYGPNLWPSLWTCAKDNWPPEIDMIEGYTYPGKLDYVNNILSTYLESNVHYNNDLTSGVKSIPTLIWKIFKKKNGINEYKFKWTKNYIKFYFNGILFKTIKDDSILNDLNNNALMYPIMNLEINYDFSLLDYSYLPVFEIYDFSYKKL